RSGACSIFADFNKLVSTGTRRLGSFHAGIGNGFHVDLDGTDGVIVTRDHVINTIGIAVGINNTDNRNTQLVGFLDGDTLVVYIDNEQGIRQAAHILDTTDGALELVHFTGTLKGFFLGQLVESTVLALGFQVTVATDRLTDGLVVGQHTTQPAVVNVRLTGTLSFFLDNLGSRALGTHKQDLVLVLSQRLNEVQRFIHGRNSLLQVDDMNLVTGAEDELRHFRVPVASLVTEVSTCLEQVTHIYLSHDSYLLASG